MKLTKDDRSCIESFLNDLQAKNGAELLELLSCKERENFEQLLSEILNKQGNSFSLNEVLSIVFPSIDTDNHASTLSTIEAIIARISSL
jgi:hypothetical protein